MRTVIKIINPFSIPRNYLVKAFGRFENLNISALEVLRSLTLAIFEFRDQILNVPTAISQNLK